MNYCDHDGRIVSRARRRTYKHLSGGEKWTHHENTAADFTRIVVVVVVGITARFYIQQLMFPSSATCNARPLAYSVVCITTTTVHPPRNLVVSVASVYWPSLV